MPNGQEWPRISIVTPNFNYGRFLEEALRSVLLQGYPNLEYVMIDGGSTDESVEIIRKYEPWLAHWESSPDRGQSSAVNKGLKFCSGKIFNWVNSDDHLMPGALETVGRIFEAEHAPDLILGSTLKLYTANTDDMYSGEIWKPIAPRSVYHLIKHGQLGLGIGQPSAFLKLDCVCEVGGAREEMHFCFDWLLYLDILLHRGGRARVRTTQKALSRQLLHPEAKTVKSSPAFASETMKFIPELLPKCSGMDRWRTRWWLRAMETRGHVTAVWDNGRGRLSELARLASQRPDALLLRCYWGAVRRRLIG